MICKLAKVPSLAGLPDEEMASAGGPEHSYHQSVREMRKQMASLPQLSQTDKLAKAKDKRHKAKGLSLDLLI